MTDPISKQLPPFWQKFEPHISIHHEKKMQYVLDLVITKLPLRSSLHLVLKEKWRLE